MSEDRFWKLYREERVKLVKRHNPLARRPFQVNLSSQQITHIARTAAKRLHFESLLVDARGGGDGQ